MKIISRLRILLLPFSSIYYFITTVRNKFYDHDLLKSHKVSTPVISIGNISTGGTGKTPLTVFIAKYILERNKTVGIVSRGYKRKNRGLVLVSDGVTINENIHDTGDELVLISSELIKNFKGKFYIVAGKDRVNAANFLINKFNPDIIILDDAFQHRKIKRDLDIVIISVSDKTNNILLPAGDLREGLSNLKRAELIIQNNKTEDFEIIPQLKKYQKDILVMRYKTEYFMDFKNDILPNYNSNVIVFSGIANDSSFVKMVKRHGLIIEHRINFPDHYEYAFKDIRLLKDKFKKGMVFITTEKDFIKIKQFKDFIYGYPVYYLKLAVELNEKNILFNRINKLLN